MTDQLAVVFGDLTDFDGVLELIPLVKAGYDIIFIITYSKPFDRGHTTSHCFEDIITSFERYELSLDDKLKGFDDSVGEGDTYSYHTNQNIDELEMKLTSFLQQMFDSCNCKGNNTLYICNKDEHGIRFFNSRNPFGYIWSSENTVISIDETSTNIHSIVFS